MKIALTALLVAVVLFLVGWIVDGSTEIETPPQPSKLVSKPFTIEDATVYEFRNSQGGTCMLVLRERNHIAIACMRQERELDFEYLPRPQ